MMKFLSLVAAAPITADQGELLLYSYESLDWLTADQAFLASLIRALAQVIEMGRKVTVIHTVNQEAASRGCICIRPA
ncbi:MAG: hypothetical protein ACPLPR_06865 [Bacillota bacterium]